jgi:hypothetical protein
MYFPKGFVIDRAIELGELVDQAYAQYAASRSGEPWIPPGGNSLDQKD